MTKKKPIIVWKNGKQAKVKRLDNERDFKLKKNYLSLFARFFSDRKKRANKGSNSKNYKPIFIAFCSAIIIGLMLGFVMLQMLKNMNGTSSEVVTSPANNENMKSEVESSISAYSFEEMNAYVIQAGVFSDKTNAEQWSNTFEQAGLKPFIWEREEQYFILLRPSSTMEEARQQLIDIESFGFDMFVKEWSTSERTLEVTAEELTWLQAFQSTWLKSLESINKQDDGVVTDDWEDLLPKDNLEPARLSKITKLLKDNMVNIDTGIISKSDAQQILLKIWKEYENLLSGDIS